MLESPSGKGAFAQDSSHFESDEMIFSAQDIQAAAENEKMRAQNKAKTSFANGQRIMNPFKQDRKKTGAANKMMTINGRVRQNDKTNLQYDPKIMAHMAKIYMIPNTFVQTSY